MEDFLKTIKKKAKLNKMMIVLPEALDERVLQATEQILHLDFAHITLLGDQFEIEQLASKLKLNIKKAHIINPKNSKYTKEFSQLLFELRKSKGMSYEKAKELVEHDKNYFATLLVQQGYADGFVSGSKNTTADTIRPALQLIKTKDMFHKVSGLFFMVLDNKLMVFADCAVNINPDAKDLAEIAIDTATTAQAFGITPKVAMLSFSTSGSAKHPDADKVIEATRIVNYKRPDLLVEGEMQVDAALVESVAKSKFKDSKINGQANCLIFPDLNSGNIAYKLVERLAKSKAIGPILQGLNKPVNDLSRGCSAQDIVDVVAITAVQAQNHMNHE